MFLQCLEIVDNFEIEVDTRAIPYCKVFIIDNSDQKVREINTKHNGIVAFVKRNGQSEKYFQYCFLWFSTETFQERQSQAIEDKLDEK
jgi:hypothetical protein